MPSNSKHNYISSKYVLLIKGNDFFFNLNKNYFLEEFDFRLDTFDVMQELFDVTFAILGKSVRIKVINLLHLRSVYFPLLRYR